MIRIDCHKSLLAGIVLLTFLFSVNGLLFGSHAAGEMFQAPAQMVGDVPEVELPCGHPSSSHHHNHSHHPHTESECCDAHGPHSHDLRSGPPLIVSLWPSFSQQRFFDRIVSIPEVYLEPFIPPQNPA